MLRKAIRIGLIDSKMRLSKKGTMALKEFVKILLYGIIAIAMIALIVKMVLLFTGENVKNQQVKDIKRVANEIRDLNKNEEYGVPIKGEKYQIRLFTKEMEVGVPYSCKKKPCLCAYNGIDKEGIDSYNPLHCEYEGFEGLKSIRIVDNVVFVTSNEEMPVLRISSKEYAAVPNVIYVDLG